MEVGDLRQNTHAFDRRNDSKTKRRRTGATYTNWDSLMMKLVVAKDGETLIKNGTALCQLVTEYVNGKKDKKGEGKSSGRPTKDEESGKKKKNGTAGKRQVEEMGPTPVRVQELDLMSGTWRINKQKLRIEVHKTQLAGSKCGHTNGQPS